MSPARSTVTCASTCPSGPSVLTSGRTDAILAPLHECSPMGRQMPEVTTDGPQSQPKLQAVLRMNWYGAS
ncbi:hypothetical protein GCM10018952_34990 [Streptosporangium vulgare]